MAAALQLQLPPGGVPVRGLAELPPDGDPRGEDALGGQARRLKLRRQGRMRDADAVQLQLTHPGEQVKSVATNQVGIRRP